MSTACGIKVNYVKPREDVSEEERKIWVRLEKMEEGRITFSVSDNGIGIQEENDITKRGFANLKESY